MRRTSDAGPNPAHEQAQQNGRKGVSRRISDVLRKGLSTSSAERYASVEQFTQALLRSLSEGPRATVPRVFVSYDRELSGGWARYFADKLKDKFAVSVFMDTTGLDRAGRFPTRLAQEIRECDVFVCFLAQSTLKSKWVAEEIRLAHQFEKLMIPVFHENYIEPELDPTRDVSILELLSIRASG